jgi:hypothetical protein
LAFGCDYDPRAGQSTNFGDMDLCNVQVFDKELDQPQMDQLRYRMELYPIETPCTKLKWEGIVIPPSADVVAGTSLQEPNCNTNLLGTSGNLRIYVRNGVDTSATGGARICMTDSPDGRNWSPMSNVIGQSFDGFAGVAVCPSYCYDTTVTPHEHLVYHASTNFGGFYLSRSIDGGTFTNVGAVTLAGYGGSVGNTDVQPPGGIGSGTNWTILIEGQDAQNAQAWTVRSAVGANRTTFAAGASNIIGGYLWCGTGGPSAFGGSSGPMRFDTGDGLVHVGLHSDETSFVYHRFGYAIDKPMWSPYDKMLLYQQQCLQMLYGQTFNSVDQMADPDIREVHWPNGKVEVLMYDDVLGQGKGGISLCSFQGTLADLFKNSVRMDVGGTLDIPSAYVQVSPTNVLLGQSFGAFGTQTGTLPSVPPPTTSQTTLQALRVDSALVPIPSGTAQYRAINTTNTGLLIPADWVTVTANVNGVISFICGLNVGYQFRVEDGPPSDVVTPTVTGIQNLPISVIGLASLPLP